MAQATLVDQLIESGIHFGHKAANWHPKMKAYIHGKKNGIHIIDIRQTLKGLLLAKKFITRTIAGGKDVLFVGTKRQAKDVMQTLCAEEAQPYVIERWLGGTLTNFTTIRSRLKRLDELDGLVESGALESYSKKMTSQLLRERKKIHRNLSGIRTMHRLPGAMVVIDVKRERNALLEARKLNIPTVCLIDTDADPDLADIPIPGNDDAMRAVEFILRQLLEAVKEGKTARAQTQREQADRAPEAAAPGGRPQRRSVRSQFRAADDAPAAEGAAPEGDAPAAEAPAAEAPAGDAPSA